MCVVALPPLAVIVPTFPVFRTITPPFRTAFAVEALENTWPETSQVPCSMVSVPVKSLGVVEFPNVSKVPAPFFVTFALPLIKLPVPLV